MRGISPAGGSNTAAYEITREAALTYGESVSGTLSDGMVAHDFTFEGQVGDKVAITVAGDGTSDPRFRVLAPDGSQVARSDDSAGGCGAFRQMKLTEGGTYTIRIDMMVAGDYTIKLEGEPISGEFAELTEEASRLRSAYRSR